MISNRRLAVEQQNRKDVSLKTWFRGSAIVVALIIALISAWCLLCHRPAIDVECECDPMQEVATDDDSA